ncbi:TSUP family transporter [Mesorhizobium sp. CC13]|uniref:TSUP family transporter n=1 Tax=Mesorhizobium sp. CC13 TaxID=3029194 RepID=UPI0032655100
MTFADVALWQYLLVAAVSFSAATIGGVTGYGTGLLLPPVLLPIVGPEAVVPVISVSALMTNGSRLAAFRKDFDRPTALAVGAFAFPACIAGAWGYTLLSGPGITLLIGTVLLALVPLRRLLMRARGRLRGTGLGAAGLGYGLLAGGTSGSGVVLITILLASGLGGTAVVATDAGISMTLGLAKVLVFRSAGFLPLSSVALALLIGVCATPGAFVARRLTSGLTNSAHIAILDAVVVCGGLLLIVQGLRG